MVFRPKLAKPTSSDRPGERITTSGWVKLIFSAGKRWRMDKWRENYPIRRLLLRKDRRMCLNGSEMSRVGVRVTRKQRRGGGSRHCHHHHHHHLNRVLPRFSPHGSFWEISGQSLSERSFTLESRQRQKSYDFGVAYAVLRFSLMLIAMMMVMLKSSTLIVLLQICVSWSPAP